jgi:hypothetical protein
MRCGVCTNRWIEDPACMASGIPGPLSATSSSSAAWTTRAGTSTRGWLAPPSNDVFDRVSYDITHHARERTQWTNRKPASVDPRSDCSSADPYTARSAANDRRVRFRSLRGITSRAASQGTVSRRLRAPHWILAAHQFRPCGRIPSGGFHNRRTGLATGPQGSWRDGDV